MIRKYENIRENLSGRDFEYTNKAYRIFQDLFKEASISAIDGLYHSQGYGQASDLSFDYGLIVSLDFGDTGYTVEKKLSQIIGEKIKEIEESHVDEKKKDVDFLKLAKTDLEYCADIINRALLEFEQ